MSTIIFALCAVASVLEDFERLAMPRSARLEGRDGRGVTRSVSPKSERISNIQNIPVCLTVLVPFSHAEELRLRKLTRNVEVARVMSFLSEGRCRRYQDWKDRFKENSERMRDGSLLAVAEVLKTLLILQAQKPLSFREKKMLDRARHMVITELSAWLAGSGGRPDPGSGAGESSTAPARAALDPRQSEVASADEGANIERGVPAP